MPTPCESDASTKKRCVRRQGSRIAAGYGSKAAGVIFRSCCYDRVGLPALALLSPFLVCARARPRGQRFRSGGTGIKLRGSFVARRSKPLAAGRVNRLALGFHARAGSRGGIAFWSGAVARGAAVFFFSVIRRLALVTAVPAVSYRAIASARRRATCARGCLRRVSTLDFRAGIFGPRSFIPWRAWRGWPPPAADFFFGYSATGAGDGGAGCQLPGHRERAAARDLRERVSTACVDSRFSSWNFRPEVFLYPLARLAAAGGGFLFRLFGDWRW